MKNQRKRLPLLLAVMALMLSFLLACVSLPTIIRAEDSGEKQSEYDSLADLKESAVGAVLTGATFADILQENGFKGELKYYNTAADAAAALEYGKVDYFVNDYPVAAHYAASYGDMVVFPELLREEDYYFLISKSHPDLQKEFNTWLAQAKESGFLASLKETWMGEELAETSVDLSGLTGENGTLKIGVNYTEVPGAYYIDNQPAGYDIDLMAHFCRDYGYAMELVNMDSGAMITSLVSEKIDIATGFISYTRERAEQVLYTDTIYSGGLALVTRTKTTESAGFSLSSWWDGIRESFVKSFVKEDRYQMVLQGLLVTLEITVLGFLLANLVGALFCTFAMSRIPVLRGIAGFYNWLMQGTPMVVILMLLYYVILGNTSLSGTWVAVIAFGLNTGAYLAQTFKGAITAISYGQTEAALSLGMTKTQAFLGIVLPQAIRRMLPGYFSEIISMMKGTAVVGYVAVVDLTKVGDIIRSSTYEAFFPLLAIAAIYLAVTSLILGLLTLVQKRLSRKTAPLKKTEEK